MEGEETAAHNNATNALFNQLSVFRRKANIFEMEMGITSELRYSIVIFIHDIYITMCVCFIKKCKG